MAEGSRREVRGMLCEKDSTCHSLLPLKIEAGATSQGTQQPLEAGKDKEMMWSHKQLDFSSSETHASPPGLSLG